MGSLRYYRTFRTFAFTHTAPPGNVWKSPGSLCVSERGSRFLISRYFSFSITIIAIVHFQQLKPKMIFVLFKHICIHAPPVHFIRNPSLVASPWSETDHGRVHSGYDPARPQSYGVCVCVSSDPKLTTELFVT